MGIELGQIVDGKYRVTACIGEGGMGAVYAGEHLKLHRKVAIKVLHAAVASDPEVASRFEREAQAAGRIGNDHILEVFDIGELPGGDRYIVMEFLDGEPMNARLARLGSVSPRDLHPLARQVLVGLGAAHAAGIVHRDLKPANIFILREKAGLPDYVKIIDFGISKFQSAPGDVRHHETRTGTIIGTPSYMSPEQARGLREADARSDIYAVGVILYEAVSGRLPFEGTSTNDLLFKIYLHEPLPLEVLATDVDPAFCTLIMKALSKEPKDRFATAGEFVAALDAWKETGRGVFVVKPPALHATVIERPPRSGAASPRSVPQTAGAWERDPATTRSRARPVAALVLVAAAAAVAGAMFLRSPTSVSSSPPSAAVAAPLPSLEAGIAAAALPSSVPDAQVTPSVAASASIAVPVMHPTKPRPVTPTAHPGGDASRSAQGANRSGGAQSPGSAPATPAASSAPKPNCSPPYVIDAAGDRQYKPECL